MTGVLFIINVPKKAYENDLKNIVLPTVFIEKEKYDKASKIIHELKEKHLVVKSSTHGGCQDDMMVPKCKSTDCLHKNKEVETFKCKSESCLTEKSQDSRSYLRASWDELKQAIKPKHKLKISKPVRGVDLLAAFHWDTPLETILAEIVDRLDIKNAVWNATKDDKLWQVTFSLESGNISEELLQVLKTFGIGLRHQSSVSVLPCALYYKSNASSTTDTTLTGRRDEEITKTAWSRFSSSVGARTNLAKVLHDVRSDAALTFDWLFMLLVAAFVSAIGLIENSTVILVASMLISPLMGPITAATLGTAVKDRSLQVMGVKNEFLGLFLSLVIGFVFGLTICAIDERYGVVEDWPTYEMISRCEYRSLWVGILVAFPSGAGVALAVLGDYTASLVGVAISASLLPPAVNAGLLWAMALTRLVVKSDELRWLVVQPGELAVLGTASLCLTLVNIVCIFLAGVAVYKVKEVSPLDKKDISWWKANRTRYESTRKSKNMTWDAYTKWFEDHKDNSSKSSSMKPSTGSTGVIHSETVAFRKRPSLIKRLRAKNLDSFCQNAQLEEFFIPIDIESNNHVYSETSESNKTHSSPSTTVNNESCDTLHDSISENAVELQTHTYFNNLSYQPDEVSAISPQPTIEPSFSYTMEPKKLGIFLSNQTFEV